LLGILLARTVSGVMSDAFGWRSMFWLAAAMMLVQAGVLARALPTDRSTERMGYFVLLRSVLDLIREEPLLRRRIIYGVFMFATFSALWTALPFLLAHPPFDYGDSIIGAFGLLGVAGAIAASFAGHLHDKGLTRRYTGIFLATAAVAFVVLGVFDHSLIGVVLGIVMVDLGVQGTQILNQSTIYQLRPEARSRLTTAYMTCFFAGGAAGSAAAAYAFSLGGWRAVAALGVGLPLLAFVYWLTEPGPRAHS